MAHIDINQNANSPQNPPSGYLRLYPESESFKYKNSNGDVFVLLTEAQIQTLLNAKQSLNQKSQPNGYASLDSNGKVPLSELPVILYGVKNYFVSATNTISTSSSTFQDISSMTKQLPVGKYLVHFSCELELGDNDGSNVRLNFNENSISESIRLLEVNGSGLASANGVFSVHTQAIINVTVDNQIIKAQYNCNAGTATIRNRSLAIVKVVDP